MQVTSFLSVTTFFLSSLAGQSMAASVSGGPDETVGILISTNPCAYIIET